MSGEMFDARLNIDALADAGVNLLAVFPLESLPASARAALTSAGQDLHAYRQLLLFGHGGKTLWRRLQAAGPAITDPVDTYAVGIVKAALDAALHDKRYTVLYPGDGSLDLQQFGALAGWHHPSPFWVGINARFGSWFAYRALVLADSDFAPTVAWVESSPCRVCDMKPCLSACPPDALASGTLDLSVCIQYRRQPDSLCRHQCMARSACPVAAEHRYDQDQMQHHYAASLRYIEAMPQ